MAVKRQIVSIPLSDEWLEFVRSLRIPDYSDGNSRLLAQLIALSLRK